MPKYGNTSSIEHWIYFKMAAFGLSIYYEVHEYAGNELLCSTIIPSAAWGWGTLFNTAEMCLGHLQSSGLSGVVYFGQNSWLFSIHVE